MKKLSIVSCAIIILSVLSTCKKNDPSPDTNCTDINLFSLSQDRQLGAQFDIQILTNDTLKAQYPLLDSVQYAAAYGHLKRITNNILNSGKVVYKDEFAWKVRIIRDDNTLNAFCTPGGYIYVFTGIIKYLDNEDDLAGVMGHEIGHADQRHSTDALVKQQTAGVVLQLLSGGNPGLITKILTNLTFLQYSRCHEKESDEASVTYLSGTGYRCNGAARFFEKIQAEGGTRTPEFLSTHPDPGNRVEAINNKAKSLNCNISTNNPAGQYQEFKNSLP